MKVRHGARMYLTLGSSALLELATLPWSHHSFPRAGVTHNCKPGSSERQEAIISWATGMGARSQKPNREEHPLESSEVEGVPGFSVASRNLGMPWPVNASPLSTSAVTLFLCVLPIS